MAELGAGSGTGFPGALDTNNTVEVNSPAAGKTKARAEVPNDLAAAIIAIQTELGVNPAGSLTDVVTWLQTQHGTDGTHTASIVSLLASVSTYTKTQTWSRGADIASATSITLGTDGNIFHITGSTGPLATINVPAGTLFILQFVSTPTLTHSATLFLNNAASDITAAAGDIMIGYAQAVNDVRGVFLKADGTAVVAPTNLDVIKQIVSVIDSAVATGTTTTPSADGIPAITEGDEYMTLAITPNATDNRLKIEVVLNLAHTVSGEILVMALHQDTTTNALAAVIDTCGAVVNEPHVFSFTHEMAAGTTSATTFRIRVGGGSGTVTFNGGAGARQMGGIMASSIIITEYAA